MESQLYVCVYFHKNKEVVINYLLTCRRFTSIHVLHVSCKNVCMYMYVYIP